MAVSQRQRKADQHRVNVVRSGVSVGDGAVAAPGGGGTDRVGGGQVGVLTADVVAQVFSACATDQLVPVEVDGGGGVPADEIVVEGVLHKAMLSRSEVARHRDQIAILLGELPAQFQPASRGGRGGWSFLNACHDRHGDQWTGLHLRMEQLFMLGLAAGLVACPMPREMWPVFPGGVPYFCIQEPSGDPS